MFWLACACAYSAGQHVGVTTCAQIASGGLLACIAVAAISYRLRVVHVALLIVFALMGMSYGMAASFQTHEVSSALDDVDSACCTLMLIDDSKASGSGERAFCEATFEEGRTVVVLATFPNSEPLYCGQVVTATASLKQADYLDDDYLWQNGAVARAYVKTYEAAEDDSPRLALNSLRANAIQGLGDGSDERAFLQAIICGYRHDVSSTALYAAFQKCGLAHLVAVSGAHLAIVVALVTELLKILRASRRIAIVVSAVAIGSFLLLSGIPVSAVRAAIMALLALSSTLARRRPSAMNALGIGILAIVVSSPRASVAPSFVLSALSTSGIVLFAPLVRYWLGFVPLSKLDFALDALALTVSANVLALPYACSIFSQLPLASPLANVLCAPLFAPICLAGLVCTVLIGLSPPIAGMLLALVVVMVRLFASLVSIVSSMPFASVPVSIETNVALLASVSVAALLWCVWPSGRQKGLVRSCACLIVAVALCVTAWASAKQHDCIVMLDVGQGDAFLVKSRGHALLIDTGNLDGQLVEQLALSATFSLDAVLITHSDDDHCGSLDALERSVRVQKVLVFSDLLESESEKNVQLFDQARRSGEEVVGLHAGDCIQVGAFCATVIWPDVYEDDGGNADSICLLVEYDEAGDGKPEFTVLFTGDAESEQLERMLDEGRVGNIDVLKVGHHGSKKAFTQDEVDVLDPEIALIGVGANNRYGHPSVEVLDMLYDRGCKVYRSDVDGQVTCVFSQETISVAVQ